MAGHGRTAEKWAMARSAIHRGATNRCHPFFGATNRGICLSKVWNNISYDIYIYDIIQNFWDGSENDSSTSFFTYGYVYGIA